MWLVIKSYFFLFQLPGRILYNNIHSNIISLVGETRVITCEQPWSLKSLELCQESSMVNHVSQQLGCIHQTWPCL